MTEPATRPRLGEMLTSSGLASSEEIARALTRQAVTYLRLGDLLVAAGVVEESVLRAVLAVQEDLQLGRERDPAELACARIGALLADRAVRTEDLERALLAHAKGDASLAEVLLRVGAVTRDQMERALVRGRHN